MRVTRLAADHPPYVEKGIELSYLTRRSQQLRQSTIRHVLLRLFGRPLHVPYWFEDRKDKPLDFHWTADFEFWTPYRFCKYLNASSKRNVKIACLSWSQTRAAPPPPPPPKKKNSRKGKNFPKLRMSWFHKQNLPRFRILQATFPVRRRSAPVLVIKLKITSWIIRKIDINIIVPVEFIIIFCSKNGPWIFLKAYTY